MPKKVPAVLKIVKNLFGITNSIAPSLADRWAVKLFLKPIPAPYTNAGKQFITKAQKETIMVNGNKLIGYSLGEGPTVICMHGWSGKTAQFAHIAQALAESGYKVVGFDALGHGANKNELSNLFEFRDLIVALSKRYPQTVCYIGHSLGAASISLASNEGLNLPRFVSLGAPVLADDILETFIQRTNGSERTKQALRKACREMFNREFDEVAMETTFKSMTEIPVLGIHGTEDFDADVAHLDVLKSIHPNMKTHKAHGLGHRRILKDPSSILKIIEFIKA